MNKDKYVKTLKKYVAKGRKHGKDKTYNLGNTTFTGRIN